MVWETSHRTCRVQPGPLCHQLVRNLDGSSLFCGRARSLANFSFIESAEKVGVVEARRSEDPQVLTRCLFGEAGASSKRSVLQTSIAILCSLMAGRSCTVFNRRIRPGLLSSWGRFGNVLADAFLQKSCSCEDSIPSSLETAATGVSVLSEMVESVVEVSPELFSEGSSSAVLRLGGAIEARLNPFSALSTKPVHAICVKYVVASTDAKSKDVRDALSPRAECVAVGRHVGAVCCASQAENLSTKHSKSSVTRSKRCSNCVDRLSIYRPTNEGKQQEVAPRASLANA
mmetsp:Transcript_23500/g.42383  ORF Transcript_23500/g.42383 Transcript_23500/m.42383 type:complete len:287 (+) Transcript_23500:47-907(+)